VLAEPIAQREAVRDVYNEDWYLAATAPSSRIWRSGDMRFAYEDMGSKLASPYGYCGIAGDPLEVRKALGMPLFIRHAIDYWNGKESGPYSFSRPTRAIPLHDPWKPGSAHLKEAVRAKRFGIVAGYHGSDPPAIAEFLRGYRDAMDRKTADPKYYTIADRLEEWAHNPSVHVVLAPNAGAMFLTGDTWAHYHLSFRRPEAHNTAMHAVFDCAVPVIAATGCQYMHLGGGTTPSTDDPLYKFKARIGRLPHTVYFQEIP
jgi:hypothetical protein